MRTLTLLLVGLTLVAYTSLDSGPMSSAEETDDIETERTVVTDGCGEVSGVEVLRDLPGLEDFGEVAGIRVCTQRYVTSQGVGAASGFIYNGREVDPATIPVAAVHTFIDSDYDGMTDARELEYGLNPYNIFDFLDHERDCVIDAMDAQAVAFRWGLSDGDQYYDVYFDRSDYLGEIHAGEGNIDINDLQKVFGQFGMTCGQMNPNWPTAQSVCNERAVQAASEGIDEFFCSTADLPQQIYVGQEDTSYQYMRVDIMSPYDIETESMTAIAQVMPGEPAGGPPMDPPEGEIASYHAEWCETNMCYFAVTSRNWDWTFLGTTCARFNFQQTWQSYYPWRVIVEVQPPIATASSSIPCDHSNLETNWDQSNLPFSSTVTGGLDVSAGFRVLGRFGQFRRWSFNYSWFIDGYFNYDLNFSGF